MGWYFKCEVICSVSITIYVVTRKYNGLSETVSVRGHNIQDIFKEGSQQIFARFLYKKYETALMRGHNIHFYGEMSVLIIRRGKRDNYPYFSIKTYVVTSH